VRQPQRAPAPGGLPSACGGQFPLFPAVEQRRMRVQIHRATCRPHWAPIVEVVTCSWTHFTFPSVVPLTTNCQIHNPFCRPNLAKAKAAKAQSRSAFSFLILQSAFFILHFPLPLL